MPWASTLQMICLLGCRILPPFAPPTPIAVHPLIRLSNSSVVWQLFFAVATFLISCRSTFSMSYHVVICCRLGSLKLTRLIGKPPQSGRLSLHGPLILLVWSLQLCIAMLEGNGSILQAIALPQRRPALSIRRSLLNRRDTQLLQAAPRGAGSLCGSSKSGHRQHHRRGLQQKTNV